MIEGHEGTGQKRVTQSERATARTGHVVELRDGVMRIGRSPDNEIVLGDASKGVSRAHAELHVENGRCTIVDLHSQNGTWLNALRVQRAEVRPDAEIAIGLYRLRLQVGGTQSVERPEVPSRPAQPATVAAAHIGGSSSRPGVQPALSPAATSKPAAAPNTVGDIPLMRGEGVTSPVPMPAIAPGPYRPQPAPERSGVKLPLVIAVVSRVV